MKKFKNLIGLSAILIVLVSTLAFALNFYLIPQIQRFTQSNRLILEDTLVAHTKLDTPLAVLKNLEDQMDEDKPMTLRHEEAFHRQVVVILETTDALEIYLKELTYNLRQINGLSLGRHDSMISSMQSDIELLKQTALEAENHVRNQSMYQIDLPKLLSILENQGLAISQIVQDGKVLELAMVRDVTLIVNVVVTLLVLILLALGFINVRYIRGGFKYMTKGFELIAKSEYDLEKLPKMNPVFVEEKQMISFVEDIIDRKKFSKELREVVASYYLVDDVMDALFEKLQTVMSIDRLGIAFIDYNKGTIIAEHGRVKSGDVHLTAGFEQPLHRSALMSIVSSGVPSITGDLEAQYQEKPQSTSLCLLLKEGMQSNMVIPLKMGQAVFGLLFFTSRTKHYFTEAELEIGEAIVDEIGVLLNKSYFTKIIFTRITSSFSELVEGKDTSTGEHIERMVQYTVTLARGVKKRAHKGYELTERDILDLERHASSHDIGKVAIPDEILKKPGKLTSDEWEIMKTHATIGADIFKHLREGLTIFDPDFFKTAEDIARSHHEKWNGSGYPLGLSGQSIPLVGRIVAIADVFDALTSKRVYKDAFSFESAVTTIKEGAGSHFDPFLVEVFLENLQEFKNIYMV